jgi:hypothetical protein
MFFTYQHYKEFEGLEESTTNMMSKSKTIKVLEYSTISSRVYYKNSYSGNVLKFIKKDDKWVLDKWEKTVWSKMGSADDFMWPYGR